MRGVDRFLPEGPTEAARRAVRYTIVCETTRADGTPGPRGVLTGSDIYGITAVTTAQAVEYMAADGYDRRGGLAPSEAFDAETFLAALAPHGIAYTVTG
jgi:short subunit dehydrogenase-like uncharacterized protein